MARITHIMDMDGFCIPNKFVCKELAIIEVYGRHHILAQIRLGMTIHDLPEDVRRSVDHVTKSVHGIPFEDLGFERYDQDDIESIIRNFVGNYPVVAYKGGDIEQKILQKMGIACVNLESIGCPKYDYLIRNPKYRTSTMPCALHRSTSSRLHCSLMEVKTFKLWYKDQKERF